MQITVDVQSKALNYDQAMHIKGEVDAAITRALQVLFDKPPTDLVVEIKVI